MDTLKNKKLKLADLDIDYSLIGRQPGQLSQPKASIIYLPGFGCDYLNHRNFANLLVSYDYYAINAPAHGRSPWFKTEDLTIKKYADLVVEFIDKWNLENLILIGHSSSAAVVALLNGMVKDKILANVLISPIETSFQTDVEKVKDILIPQTEANLIQLEQLKIFNYDMKSFNNNEWNKYKFQKLAYYLRNYNALSLMLDSLLSNDLKKSIEKLYTNISAPTMILFGDSDGLLRINDVANKMRNIIPNSQICIIPMAGHEPALDNPSNYYSNVVTFIDQIMLSYEISKFDLELGNADAK